MGIELHGEYVEYISSWVDVVCILPGHAKDLSASPRNNTAYTLSTSLQL